MKMSIKQWKAYSEAKKEGDTITAQRIMDLGFAPDYEDAMLDFKEADIEEVTEFEPEDILDAVAGGMPNKEIYEKFGITAQKLVSIKKGAE